MMQTGCGVHRDYGMSRHLRNRGVPALLCALLVLTAACSDLIMPVPRPDSEVRIKLGHFRDGVAPDTIVFFGRVFNDLPSDTLHYRLEVIGDSTMLLERHGFFAENQFQAALAYDPEAHLVFSCLAWITTDSTEAVFATR